MVVRDYSELGLATALCWTLWGTWTCGKTARWKSFMQRLNAKQTVCVTLLLSIPLVLEHSSVAAFAGAPRIIPTPSAVLRATTVLSIGLFVQELDVRKTQGCAAAEGREKLVVPMCGTSRFAFSGLIDADALAADVVAAQGGSQEGAASGFTHPATNYPSWQASAASADATHPKEATDDTGSPNDGDRGIPEELTKTGKSEEGETENVGNEDKNAEEINDATELNAKAGSSSTSDSEDDDILSFLQLAMGAAAVLAVSTWLLLEQRKALHRARYVFFQKGRNK